MSETEKADALFKNLHVINPDEKIVYCKRCVLSNQRPRVQFNDEGICGQCLYNDYKNTIVDWDKREKELEILCDKYRSNNGSWDVIVPGSGGKDSGYVAYTLKKKFGMHPLTVTWASAITTDIGNQNLYNFTQAGFDDIFVTPNGKIHRKFSKLAFMETGDHFLPFSYGQLHVPIHIAVKFKIPFLMYGEHGELEYGGSLEDYNKSKIELTSDEYIGREFAPSSNPTSPEYWDTHFEKNELQLYKLPPREELQTVGIEEYFFSYFENWKPEMHYEVAKNNLGFSPNPTRSEGTYTDFASLDDKTDGFHYYLAFLKFGIGRATSDAAHQVRQGIITRDEAVDLVLQYDGEYPSLHEKEFLEYMEMDKKILNEVFDKFRRPIIWKKDDDQWVLRQQVTKL
jgi:N-acetyl sugar amidotransferase